MYIRTLTLTDFRNYERLAFEPSEGTNILVGRNAQGKSAMLEAIYLLATSKSHRTSRDMDMIRIGQQASRVTADVARSVQNDVSVEIILDRSEKKTVRINTVKHAKVADIVGQVNVVIFSTADLEMVKGEPSRRRRFLNLEISQISPGYVYALGRYKRVLDQRNNLLREIGDRRADGADLDVWDTQLAAYGATLISRRASFVESLSDAASGIFNSLTNSTEELTVTYKSTIQVDAAATEEEIGASFLGMLAARREMDITRGSTSVGPHRDDLLLGVNGLPAREFGSQGQHRTMAIALKLAEIDLMFESVGEAPVVLLDDVMAELDKDRRRRIAELTSNRCQTIMTTANLGDISEAAIAAARVYDVEGGRVTPR
ncbi:MAG: hypothetical protein A2Z18_08375 [Armatimonadetes bacterium RBG_16_58_9]|nr:MAG: hypothetical protein A2Z18_08375 [Armatimonadetes bacterium RBG_16_58_9]